ncbi:unnamed protein product [Diamesa hyperborea]
MENITISAAATTLTAENITTTTLLEEDLATTTLTEEDLSTTPDASNQKPNGTETKNNSNNGSAFYKVLLGIAITLLVVAIFYLVKKYNSKFNFCKPYERVDEEELLEPATEMT